MRYGPSDISPFTEYDHDSGYNRQSSVSSAQSHDSSINDEKRGSINAGNHSVMELGSKFVNVAGSGVAKGVENIAMEGYKTAQIATKGDSMLAYNDIASSY